MESIWYLDLLIDILVTGEQTDGAYSVLDVWGPPGFATALHVHRDAEEGYYLKEGEITVWYGDEIAVLHAGDFLLLPRGVPHMLKHTGDGDVRMLGVCTPAGFEDFVRNFGTLAPRRELPVVTEPLDIKRAIALGAAAGIDIIGPPGMLPTQLAKPPAA
ncbi:MAG: hypothetical protein QOG94_1761 [Solirubrobacteraceae bacterium]|jgi:mannose-6-phosphate isomerase-like protein (cupin superfamily)|nr:hypothetical protein [Solirubrobacteraceae bacterium]MEA2139726.1 hypothetical protein [Solirubrobacteraceae bacterium]